MQVPCIFPMTECWREESRSRAGGIHSPVEMADLGDVDACIRLAAAPRVQQAGIARSKTIYIFAIISKESIEKMNLTIPFYPCIISSVFRALPEGKYGITQEEYK